MYEKDGTDDIGCLPNKAEVGEEDIDEKILVKRNTCMMPTEHAEEKVGDENTQTYR